MQLNGFDLFSYSSFDRNIYQRWLAGVDEACSFNLAQPLVVRNEETNFIAVNFDPQVIDYTYALVIYLFICFAGLSV